MASTKLDKLKTMAERGGSPNEREMAKAKLQSSTLPAVPSEESGDTWTGQGVLTRNRGGAKAYLRGESLRYFLSKVEDSQTINIRTVPLSDNFGTGDFYTVLSWLLKNDLCVKLGSKYQIKSRKLITAKWNKSIDLMRL